ncbi:hypothetical protein BDD26_1987 [Xenorhabdus cabanillasii]|uniref:Uncharacterized protein n=1 Tax=Xenorhabdus cabanillasii TaxID=351673 RepID=A0A3D9UCM8_9GAMM|nr:hypothetical protein [Xenorhabdus cabanillasii]REF27232.1 hypothetical protein BDD26_1987 [Xenorhabdus cabanillasii]
MNLITRMENLGFSVVTDEVIDYYNDAVEKDKTYEYYNYVDRSANYMKFNIVGYGHEDKAKVAKELIKEGALFSRAGRIWPPEEVMRYYRERGLIMENYKTIAWYSGKYYIYDGHTEKLLEDYSGKL